MTFTLPKKGLRVTAGDLKTLLDRTEAKNSPIEQREFKLFMRHPNGYAPEQCVGLERLLPQYGEPICVYVTPKNELCLITAIDEALHVVCGSKKFRLEPMTDEVCNVSLLGFDPQNQPISLLQKTSKTATIDFLFWGERMSIGQFINPSLLSDGSVVYATESITKTKLLSSTNYDIWRINKSKTTRLGEMVLKRPPKDFVLSSYGILGLVDGYHFDILANIETGERSNWDILSSMVEVNGKPYLISYDGRLFHLNKEGKVKEAPGSTERFDNANFRYKKWFTILPNGKKAYVAEAKQGLECWVINKQPQPGFDLVSPLFKRDGQLLYFAYIEGRRHIYTMATSE